MSIFDKYDVDEYVNSVEIPQKPKDGLILVVGSSGAGKTTILNHWGMVEEKINESKPIYKLFDSEEKAEFFLIAAGFRSVPSWRRKITQVSNGERHRAEIAVKLSKESPFIDEFTSVVDRQTARALCHSINKLKNKNMVISTCHKDVTQWLDADYIYDADLRKWLDRGSLRRNSNIEIEIRPCDTEAVWEIFKKHHYLSMSVNKSANTWAIISGSKIIGMTSVIAFPSKNWKNGWRGHRTVILPEFQGMGIGTKVSDIIADYIVSTGARYFSKTSHPAFGEHRNNSPAWRATSKNMVIRKDYKSDRKTKEDGHKLKHANRLCYSHEYIGIKT